MSWIDNIKEQLTIITGDGKTYTPLWLNALNSVEYNVAEFEFSGVTGTLVKRKRPKGIRHSLQLFFTGEDHLDQAEAFRISASDPRYWTISHPYFGLLVVQPVSLEFDNTKHNVTEIKGTVVETITEDFPATTIIPKKKIANDVATTNEAGALYSSDKINAFGIKTNTLTRQREFIGSVNATVGNLISNLDGVDEYYNAFNQASQAVNTLSSTPLQAVRSFQSFLSKPAQFSASVRSRIDTLAESVTSLSGLSGGGLLMDSTLYEVNGAALIAAMCAAASTPQEEDFQNGVDVLSIIELIIAEYDGYLTELDALQSDNGGSPSSYIPDAETMTELSGLVNYTVGSLYEIALNARQERSLILEKDSNWILLAHRLYGWSNGEGVIEDLINQNGAGLSEMLQVKKNRKILYYI